MLGPSCAHDRITFGAHWGHFVIPLESRWGRFGITFEIIWYHFEITLGSGITLGWMWGAWVGPLAYLSTDTVCCFDYMLVIIVVNHSINFVFVILYYWAVKNKSVFLKWLIPPLGKRTLR